MASFIDQNSWSFLFKRWSEDYENSQRLQQELAALKQQYDCLLAQFQVLQQQDTRAQSVGCGNSTKLSENVRELQIQYLKDENDGLRRALQQREAQAADDSQSISKLNDEFQRLTMENTNLAEERDQMMKRYEEIAYKFKDLLAKVKMAHDTNTRLEEQETEATRQLEALHAEMTRVAMIVDKLQDADVHHKELMTSYEKQIHEMKQSLDIKDNENRGLRDELSNSRDVLQKLRESNRHLTTTVANLPGTILHKLNNAHAPSGDATQQQHLTHQQKPQTASSTNKTPNGNTSTTTDGGKSKIHDSKFGEKIIMQAMLQSTTDSAALETNMQSTDIVPMPLERRQAFAGVPQVVPDIADIGEKDLFERNFLRSTIGGTIQSLFVQVTESQTPLAKARQITSYLCPGLDHNPWCPVAPGDHGYMFVGLGREKDTFLEPQDYNIFVGLLKNKNYERRKYRYVGVYRAIRVSPLNVGEWNALSESVKETYVSRTKAKTDDPRTLAQVRAAYDEGQLAVPCVKLQCVDYDQVLFASLVESNSKPLPVSVNESHSSTKRRRVDSTQVHRKRVTLLV